MIPLVDKPHITVRVNSTGVVEGVTTNISPDVQVNICYEEKYFNETKQGDAYTGNVQVICVDPSKNPNIRVMVD